jgi:hypothetical protein
MMLDLTLAAKIQGLCAQYATLLVDFEEEEELEEDIGSQIGL